MKRIILITHGDVAKSYKDTIENIFKSLHHIDAICLESNDSLKDFKDKLDSLKLSNTEEYIIFVDIVGGTPYHVACVYFKNFKNAHIIYGLNLPMLFSAASNNNFDAELIINEGVKSVGKL